MTTKKIVGVKLTGELKQWQRDGESRISYHVGDQLVYLKLMYPLVHYPEGRDVPEHYLARTTTGEYYLLKLDEELL